MAVRYAAALSEIRSLLAGRSQAEPILEAPAVWEVLTCWPVPSVRAVRRLMEQVRAEIGRGGQQQPVGRDGQTVPAAATYARPMPRKQRIDQLQTQCEASQQRLDAGELVQGETTEILKQLIYAVQYQGALINELRRLRSVEELARRQAEHLQPQCNDEHIQH